MKVYKDFMEDEQFENRDRFIFILIKGFSQQRYDSLSMIAVDNILSLMGIAKNSRNKLGIKESMENLINVGLIKVYTDFGCKSPESDIKYNETYFIKIYDDDFYNRGYFTKIYYNDMSKFFMMDDNNKPKVFALYYNIISRIYDMVGSDRYTLVNVEELVKESNINRKTVTKYISILKENELIYYTAMRKSSEKTKNVYGRWEDREVIRDFADNN